MDSSIPALREELRTSKTYIGYNPVYPMGEENAYGEDGITLQKCALPGDFSMYTYSRPEAPQLYVMVPSVENWPEGLGALETTEAWGLVNPVANAYSAAMGGKIKAYQAGKPKTDVFVYNEPSGPNQEVVTDPVLPCQLGWNANAFASNGEGSEILAPLQRPAAPKKAVRVCRC